MEIWSWWLDLLAAYSLPPLSRKTCLGIRRVEPQTRKNLFKCHLCAWTQLRRELHGWKFRDHPKALGMVPWAFGFYQIQNHLKYSEKICNVCGGHLIFMNFPPRNWEGYYAYSSRVGGKLCLLIDVRTLPLLSRHKNPPIHWPPDLH